jgi:hypothetical protein
MGFKNGDATVREYKSSIPLTALIGTINSYTCNQCQENDVISLALELNMSFAGETFTNNLATIKKIASLGTGNMLHGVCSSDSTPTVMMYNQINAIVTINGTDQVALCNVGVINNNLFVAIYVPGYNYFDTFEISRIVIPWSKLIYQGLLD